MKALSEYQSELRELEGMKKYNKSRIFKNAYYRMRRNGISFSEALKESWKAAKDYRAITLKAEIDHVNLKIRKLYELDVPATLCVEMFNQDMNKAYNRGIKIN